ncbi:hypothetical protein LWI29_038503 [Acer saccharum]|uniref:Calmodulin-binding protein n=1 Tax=Acer saccharum TaxID=4024 RepID=A0AA39SQ27_ACESA|nr:hypothetical protein LWI29_038503 [Acer saccharum]
MSTSSEELELLPAIEKAVQAEVERRMKPGKKRARTLAMEQVMERVTERVMERVMERVTEQLRVIKREMKRVIKRKMKRKCKVVKVPQGAPTDRNVYARTSEVKEYRLLFVNKLHNIIYTKDKIRDDDDGSVKIKLIDANSGEIENVGCLSSIGIEIVVLGGDFGFEGQENWTKKKFKAKIVHQRGDKPLLKGKQNITLRDGVGSIDDLSFSVNSRWIECKKFRLGARVLQSSSNMGQVRIREAITEAFTVRDQRGKMLHLEKIKEGGKFHNALIDNHICSGSDLKLMYKTNPAKLRKILKGCSKWEWEVIVHHASCVLDDANSNPSRSQEAEANNTATTGSTRMQNDSNRASSSQYLAENFQNPASQPPDMSIPHSHANSQLILSNDSHQPLNSYYDDLGWYQSLFNDPLE